MKRWIVFGVVAVVLAAAVPIVIAYLPGDSLTDPQPYIAARPTGPTGKLVVEGDLAHNFGTMGEKQKGTHTWIFKNAGKGDLEVRLIQTSCSCTLSNLKDKALKLEPGKSEEITLSWDTKGKTHAYQQNAQIGTSDPENPEVTLYVKGFVEQSIITMPDDREVAFGLVTNHEPHSLQAALNSPTKPDMKITELKTSSPQIAASYRPLSVEEKSTFKWETGYRIDITVKPSKELGAFREELTIETDHPLQGAVTFEVTGRRRGPINLMPSEIRDNRIPASEGAELSTILGVLGQEKTNFEVTEKPKGFDVKIARIEPKNPASKLRQYKMTVTVPRHMASGLVVGNISLKTDHPEVEVVRIPVSVGIEGGD